MKLQFLLSMATLAIAQSAVTTADLPDASAFISQLNDINAYISTMDPAQQESIANMMSAGYEQGVSIANSFISTIMANTDSTPTPTAAAAGGEIQSQGAAPTFGSQGMMAGLAGVGIAALGML